MKEYVVTFKTSQQISPDDWEVFNPSMKVSEETTVKEIAVEMINTQQKP